MRITDITLHNYKSFEGTCNICGLVENLTPDKPILLFGGLNGAGKTSIFEALLLCLYGKFNKTLFPSKGARLEDYESYIASATNENAKSASLVTEMYVELGLDQVEFGGVDHSLRLRRNWICQSGVARETGFRITQNGRPIEFVSEEEYTDFVRSELIPYEVAEFFFFDGERIQDFIKDEDKAFAESLEAVLGIGSYRRLRDDVDVVRRRLVTDYNKDKEAATRLREIKSKIAEAEEKVTECGYKIEELKEDKRQLDEQVDNIDNETQRITRVSAETKEDLDTEKVRLTAEKTILDEQIFEAVQESLPFVMMGELCQELLQQLVGEQELKEEKIARQKIEAEADAISRQLFEDEASDPPLTDGQKAFYITRLQDIFSQQFEGSSSHTTLLHDLSLSDTTYIRQQVENTRDLVSSLTTKLSRLSEVEPKLKQMTQAEQRATSEETKVLYEKRGALKQQLDQKDKEIESLEVEIRRRGEDVSSFNRQLGELEDKVTRHSHMQNQIEYCQKMRSALDAFSIRLRAQKVQYLEQYTLKMWQLLARKQDQIASIKIDSANNFLMFLFDTQGRKIDKTKLSAGEKEILAISLIWALRNLANRSLPIVIDTPLGRLDSKHRIKIAQNYFPRASHQVILLSTDTEIVDDEYQAISPFVCKELLIYKDSAAQTSTVHEGYFQGGPTYGNKN